MVPRRVTPALHPDDENDLVRRAKNREEAALRAIIQRHNRRLFRIARSVVRDDSEAEDIVQEAYCRALVGISEFRGDSKLATWLSRIVLNEALGRLRRRRPTLDPGLVEGQKPQASQVIPFPMGGPHLDPERTMAQRQIQLLLERAIDELPDAFRTVLVARVIEEMSVEETAELFGLQPETVKTRVHRARRLLREALEKRIGPVLTDAFPFAGRRCERMADEVIKRIVVVGK
jgi:RNA polymerase sigma-70 factor, ECF subfamily